MWASEPEVPVKATVAFAAVADALAKNANDWGVPGVRVTIEGDVVIPAGRPLACTLICDEKPFEAVAEIETNARPPG